MLNIVLKLVWSKNQNNILYTQLQLLHPLRESSIKDFPSFDTKTLKLYILFIDWRVFIELLGSQKVRDEWLICLGQSAALMVFV